MIPRSYGNHAMAAPGIRIVGTANAWLAVQSVKGTVPFLLTQKSGQSPYGEDLARGASDDHWPGGYLALTARLAAV